MPGEPPWRKISEKDVPGGMVPRGTIVASGEGALPTLQGAEVKNAAAIVKTRIYILDVNAEDRVLVLDGDNLDVLGTVPIGQSGPIGMAISPDERQLFVAIRPQSAIGGIPARPAAIQVLVANPLALNRRIDLPATVIPRLVNHPLVVSPDGRNLYLVNEGPFTPPVGFTVSSIVRIDLARGAITGEVGGLGAENTFGSLAISSDGRMLYSLTSGRETSLAFIDLESFSIMTRLRIVASIGISSDGPMAIHPNGSRVYVASSPPARIQVIDTVSAQFLAPIPVTGGRGARDLLISPDGRFLFTHDSRDGSMFIVDVKSETVVGEFPVGPSTAGGIGIG